jgi:hypothetical protein
MLATISLSLLLRIDASHYVKGGGVSELLKLIVIREPNQTPLTHSHCWNTWLTVSSSWSHLGHIGHTLTPLLYRLLLTRRAFWKILHSKLPCLGGIFNFQRCFHWGLVTKFVLPARLDCRDFHSIIALYPDLIVYLPSFSPAQASSSVEFLSTRGIWKIWFASKGRKVWFMSWWFHWLVLGSIRSLTKLPWMFPLFWLHTLKPFWLGSHNFFFVLFCFLNHCSETPVSMSHKTKENVNMKGLSIVVHPIYYKSKISFYLTMIFHF